LFSNTWTTIALTLSGRPRGKNGEETERKKRRPDHLRRDRRKRQNDPAYQVGEASSRGRSPRGGDQGTGGNPLRRTDTGPPSKPRSRTDHTGVRGLPNPGLPQPTCRPCHPASPQGGTGGVVRPLFGPHPPLPGPRPRVG